LGIAEVLLPINDFDLLERTWAFITPLTANTELAALFICDESIVLFTIAILFPFICLIILLKKFQLITISLRRL
jgi:hypothetical protein